MIAKIASRASYLLLSTLISFAAKSQLKADFGSNIISGCSPLIVQFQDNSAGNPTEWKWDLGNGTVSYLKNPSVSYFDPGTYTISLIIKKDGVYDTIVKPNYISVFGKPVADFTSDTTSGCFPLKVKFTDITDAVSGQTVKWEWDFGDGYNSDLQHPEHNYLNAGNYNVTLRVTNSNGCATTISKTSYIRISDGVTANFTNNSPSVCAAPVSFDFQNTSSGKGDLLYNWNFGDGYTSSDENPRHIYAAAGNYSVKLVVTSSTGCKDSVLRENMISIGNRKADFKCDIQSCPGINVAFRNNSSPTPSSVMWYFGDGSTSTEMNPTKAYSAAGTYEIKLIANFGNCTDSAFRKITILQKPVADFSIDKTNSCATPFNTNFTNLSLNGVDYSWSFGDGGTSTDINPSHAYTKEGIFDVTLTVTNGAGCSQSITKSGLVQINLPHIQILNAPDSGCTPFTKTLAYTSNMPLTSYTWDLGDGNISNEASPENTYTHPGRYTVTLTGETDNGCRATAVMQDAIIASDKPHVEFSATPLIACAIQEINFTDESTGDITKWFWNFHNGTSTLQNPTHVFSDTGAFNIQLIVWNSGCSDTLEKEKYIYINSPIAKFNYTNSCEDPYQKTFTDKSKGADTWFWEFGDGTTSTLQSPVHTYSKQGTYTVKLTVYNNTTGCSFDTKQAIPVVITSSLFYASDTIICKNSPVTFSVPATFRTNVSGYDWDFGDGTKRTTTTGSVSYSYPKAGTYTVSLIITNTLGCKDTLIKTDYVQVYGPSAVFESPIIGSCLNTQIDFIDKSVSDGKHPIQRWIWNYGDGKIDTVNLNEMGRPARPADLYFEHAYTVPGFYTVSLKTIDSYGCTDNYTLPAGITISKPKASFTSNDTLSCPNKPVAFSNYSAGSSLGFLWSFGDQSTSINTHPTHLYATNGIYTVSLVVTDRYGCTDTAIKTNLVNITLPKADFLMSDTLTTCPPVMVSFTDKSSYAVSKKWDFGDSTFSTIDNPSHFYTYPGSYKIRQTITGPGGCVDIKEKILVVRGPKGTFSYDPLSGCNPITINFKSNTQDRLSFVWDFSDGTILSTKDSMPSHKYEYFGAYVPRMIMVDSSGCSVAISGQDTIKVNGANARFNFISKTFCDSGFVSFTDSSSSFDKMVSYRWDFGDGALSADKSSTTHQYTVPGIYIPSLIIKTESGCIDTTIAGAPIKVVPSPKIGISKIFNGCVPLDATFKGIILNPDTSALKWDWSFGNGNTSSIQNPAKQFYTTAGVYDIHLKVTNSSGCFDTLSKNIEAYPIPAVTAGIDTLVCKGKGVQLNASGATTYIWRSASTLSCLNCASPTATPTSETRYFVTGTSAYGCTDTASVDVKVKYPFKMSIGRGDTLCHGESAKLLATGAYSYTWSPSAGLNDISSNNPTAVPDSTTTYRVIGTDDRNCFSDTGYVRVKVYPIPVVDAGEDKTINVGQSITLSPKVSNDVTIINWSPSLGILSQYGNGNVSLKPKETTEYTVSVSNPGGCTSQDKVSIFVTCNGSNIFMPNTFSPNGDGVNDIYYPRGTGIFSIKTLRIFNRWGEIVYERNNFRANDAAAGWDGTFHNTKLNADVFVYTLEVVCDNNNVLTFKGNIALIN